MQNVELFKKMCSGYISYFKGGNPEAYPYKKVILMNHAMQPYQYSEYKRELVKEIDKDKKSKDQNKEEFIVKMISSESKTDETTTSVFNNSRLICNIAFPEIKLTDNQINFRASFLYAGEEISKKLDRDVEASREFAKEAGFNTKIEVIENEKDSKEADA